jgi:hypothetical protein
MDRMGGEGVRAGLLGTNQILARIDDGRTTKNPGYFRPRKIRKLDVKREKVRFEQQNTSTREY